jgi:hypothetical protein
MDDGAPLLRLLKRPPEVFDLFDPNVVNKQLPLSRRNAVGLLGGNGYSREDKQ